MFKKIFVLFLALASLLYLCDQFYFYYNVHILSSENYSKEDKKKAYFYLLINSSSNITNKSFYNLDDDSLYRRSIKIENLVFQKSILKKYTLDQVTGSNVKFIDSQIENFEITASITNCSIKNTKIENLVFWGSSKLLNLEIKNCEISHISGDFILENVNVVNLVFTDRNNRLDISLHKGDIKNCSIKDSRVKVCFSFSNLSKIDFSGTQLKNSSFIESNLVEINFTNADLENVDFSKIHLENVNFSNANLKNVNLIEVLIENSINLTVEQIASCKSIENVQGLSDEFLKKVTKINPSLTK